VRSVRLEPRPWTCCCCFSRPRRTRASGRTRSPPPPGRRAIGDDTLAAAVSDCLRALGGTREAGATIGPSLALLPRGRRASMRVPIRATEIHGPPEPPRMVGGSWAAGVGLRRGRVSWPRRGLLRGGDGQAPGLYTAHQGFRRPLIVRHYVDRAASGGGEGPCGAPPSCLPRPRPPLGRPSGKILLLLA